MKNLLLGALLLLLTTTLPAQSKLWNNFEKQAIPDLGEKRIIPQKYQTFKLTKSVMQTHLQKIRATGKQKVKDSPFTIQLPLPDGSLATFRIAESPVMAPDLAARFPEISTYAVQGIDNPYAHGRLDWTPAGFHGMIMSPEGTVYIDPVQTHDDLHYNVYFKKDFIAAHQDNIPACQPLDYDPAIKKQMQQLLQKKNTLQASPSGTDLRTYRTAVAATGEYTQFHGGTVSLGQAAIVTAINRVTGIYEVEIACRLELVANNNLLVYTNAATDPYTNGSPFALLGENQANCDAVIGNGNYDIGHVFSTGGGGLAALGVVCNNSNKARGETGLSSPTGDPFYVDYVAHEIGHQFGGNHTFNGTSGSCGGNRSGSTAYEPGSGTTIQAYAGICGGHNTASNSDDYFHTASFDEMVSYTTGSTGNTCPTTTNTGNSVPVPNAGSGAYTIPINTPFALTGSATDADGDALSYNWEQYDLGPAGDPNNPSGNAPIFRSFPASTSPTRTFPQVSDLVNNTQTIGEILPTYGRTLTFRMTVRDNKADGGGVDYDQISVTVDAGSGPFLVTTPNTAVTWTIGQMETVNWDVADTDMAPVSCPNVDILVSTDGGLTFPVTLASGVANDGSQSVLIIGEFSTQARIKVVCSNNVFFDISNVNFTILMAPLPVELIHFSARAVDKDIHLEWMTATEIDNKGFEIERSLEPSRDFEKIGWVAAGANKYDFADKNAVAGLTYYYRLRQLDFSGEENYSEVVSAELKEVEKWDIILQPNPASDQVEVISAGNSSRDIDLRIYTINGKEIYRQNRETGDSWFIDLAYFPAGVYILKGKTEEKEIVKRLIVK